MALATGMRLGPYELLGPLGAGGMGEVYRARDVRLGREVAVKMLPESFAGNAEALARFEREAKAVASLSHPNILALHDYGREADVSYAAMELLEGETLRDRMTSGPLPVPRAVDFALQIAQGLAAADFRPVARRAPLASSGRQARFDRAAQGRRGMVRALPRTAPRDPGRSPGPITGGAVGLP